MDEIARNIERMMLGAACKEANIPKEIAELMDSLVHCGCPVKCVLAGMIEFGERMKRKEELEDLMELVKGLPIIFEEE